MLFRYLVNEIADHFARCVTFGAKVNCCISSFITMSLYIVAVVLIAYIVITLTWGATLQIIDYIRSKKNEGKN